MQGYRTTAGRVAFDLYRLPEQLGDKTIAFALVPNQGTMYYPPVRIIAKRALREFWTEHVDEIEPLKAWYAIVSRADWKGPMDVKATFGNASIVANNRAVFNIKGNDYRLVARFAYGFGRCWVRFIGTHAEYDKIDVTTV